MRVTELAHILLARVLRAGDFAVDATVGNGHDTEFLALAVGAGGRVIGFDVQQAALERADERMADLAQVQLICASHENLGWYLPEVAKGHLAAVTFNLGYLPGAEKNIITQPETTLAALDQAINNLRVGGVITIILYTGHEGGAEEASAVQGYTENLPSVYSASHYVRLNPERPAPSLIVIERLR